MKHQMMISLIAAAGMTVPAMSALAAGFGGGWMHDKHTGTLSWTLAPEPAAQQAAVSDRKEHPRLNSFGGGWVQDKNTGTLTWSRAPEPVPHTAGSHSKAAKRLNSFGDDWVQDRHSNTLSFYPREQRQTAYD